MTVSSLILLWSSDEIHWNDGQWCLFTWLLSQGGALRCSGGDCSWGIYAMGIVEIMSPEAAEHDPHNMFSDLCWWKCWRPQTQILRPGFSRCIGGKCELGYMYVLPSQQQQWNRHIDMNACVESVCMGNGFHLCSVLLPGRHEEAVCFYYCLLAPEVFSHLVKFDRNQLLLENKAQGRWRWRFADWLCFYSFYDSRTYRGRFFIIL